MSIFTYCTRFWLESHVRQKRRILVFSSRLGWRTINLVFIFSFLLVANILQPTFAQERLQSIPDVRTQFLSLKHHGEWLGFNLSGYKFDDFHVPSRDALWENTSSHWQGIQRYNASNGTPYLLVSTSRNASGKAGNLAVVKLASRDKDGERLRSNRLVKGSKTKDTQPPSQDTIVRLLSFSEYQHIGGTQVVGNVIAIPAETKVNSSSSVPSSRVYFFDLSTLPDPTPIAYHLDIPDHNAGVVGITDLPDGRYMLALAWGNGEEVEFYKSNSGNWNDPNFGFFLHSTFHYSDMYGDDYWPYQSNLGDIPLSYSHQTLNFIKQDDGKLFLLGTHNTSALTPSSTDGKDLGVLYEVTGTEDDNIVTLKPAGGMQFYSRSPGSTSLINAFKIINFNASVGAYVSPTKELILYATEHYAQGPGTSVQVAEFRHRDVYRSGSPNYYPTAVITAANSVLMGGSLNVSAANSKPAKARQWVELYQDTTGWQTQTATLKQQTNFGATWEYSPDSDRKPSVVIDEMDISKDDYDNFGGLDQHDGIITPKGFHDTASSVRFWAPKDCGPNLYEDDSYEGKVLSLRNTTSTRVDQINTVSDLKNFAMRDSNGNSTNANDKTSSVTFSSLNCSPAPVTQFSWSLAPGSVGSLSETGSQEVKFYAGNKAGIATIQLHACTSANVCSDTSTQISVIQIGPQIEKIHGENQVRKNHDLILDITFTNPDAVAQHQIEIDWGDSLDSFQPVEANQRFVQRSHQYSVPGNYTIVVRLRDQNNHTVRATHDVEVIDPAPRIEAFGLDEQINEGAVAELNVSYSLTDKASAFIDWGDGSAKQSVQIGNSTNQLITAQHLYNADGNYQVKVELDDGVDVVSQTKTLIVQNVVPIITNVGINERGLSAIFTDPGLNDHHSLQVNWDDQTTIENMAIPTGSREFSINHSYKAATNGFGKTAYQVVLKLTDGTDVSSKTVQINVRSGDLDSDRDIDRNDLNLLLSQRNKTVSDSVCGSRCDLDKDGIITVQDGRKLSLICSRPGCAIN